MNGSSVLTEIYATLAAPIDGALVQKIFAALNVAVTQKVETVHLLLHSTGGVIPDGIALYNYLRALPINLVTYNAGLISSIAVLPFLAAKERKASASARFMIHKATNSPAPGATALRLSLGDVLHAWRRSVRAPISRSGVDGSERGIARAGPCGIIAR